MRKSLHEEKGAVGKANIDGATSTRAVFLILTIRLLLKFARPADVLTSSTKPHALITKLNSMESTINKIQINSSVDTDQAGKIIKRSMLLNVRCDTPQEAISLFQDLQRRLSGNTNFEPDEIKYEGLPFDEPKTRAIAAACPKCGKSLKERRGATGNFLGCTGFPDCRFTTKI
jgi:hypothetical protein